MRGIPKKREGWFPAGHSEARAAAALPIAGAGLVFLSLALPHPSGGDEAALTLTAAAMAVIGVLCSIFAARIPHLGVHVILAAVVAATGLLIYESGVAAGQYGTIWVWATLISSYFYPRRIAAAHLAWLLVVYAVVLLDVESTAGY
ncbi:MAG TPA: hypothetical protein VFP21_00345, partial [Solirubrobacterales bacterium]|nr:hypothetical protein [Solirubrobacterales bacterium]